MGERERISVELWRRYRVSAATLFAAWTSEDMLGRFMCPGRMDAARATVDVRVGGRYHIDMIGTQGSVYPHDGEYLVVDRPRRLQFTWISLACPPELRSVVTIDLLADGGEAEMILVHDGVPDEEQREGHLIGWNAIMDQLEEVVAGAESSRSV